MKKTISEKNKQELQHWLENSKYSNIRFWVSPSYRMSEDELIMEVLHALKNLEKDITTGNLIVNTEKC